MKKVLIVSATLKNNYKLAKNVESLLNGLDVQTTLISLENYNLPIYTEDIFEKENKKYKNTVESLTKEFVNNKGVILFFRVYN